MLSHPSDTQATCQATPHHTPRDTTCHAHAGESAPPPDAQPPTKATPHAAPHTSTKQNFNEEAHANADTRHKVTNYSASKSSQEISSVSSANSLAQPKLITIQDHAKNSKTSDSTPTTQTSDEDFAQAVTHSKQQGRNQEVGTDEAQ